MSATTRHPAAVAAADLCVGVSLVAVGAAVGWVIVAGVPGWHRVVVVVVAVVLLIVNAGHIADERRLAWHRGRVEGRSDQCRHEWLRVPGEDSWECVECGELAR